MTTRTTGQYRARAMWDVRAIEESEVDRFRSRLSRAFGVDPDSDEEAKERFLEVFEIDRTFAAFDQSDIVGTGAAFSFDLTVPGGSTVPMGGTTIVSVQPTHRRRGVLTAMMDYHLDEVSGRGEPVAGLWASETSIYGRFGFGTATHMYETKLQTKSVSMATPEPSGRVRLVDAEEAMPFLESVFEMVRPTVPGMLSRSDVWWKHRLIADPESRRGGKSARRYAVFEDETGEALGYALYRQREKWEDFPDGEIHLLEVLSATPDAHRGLWGYLTNIDLYPNLEWWNSPVDDALPFHVTDPRRIQRRLSDSLWIRLIDIPRALEARSYESDGGLVMNIHDVFRPANSGTYHLEVADGSASCIRIEKGTSDISCSIEVLGHLYLGGGNGLGLARAGRIEGDQSAIRHLHRIFRTDRAPWCQEIF